MGSAMSQGNGLVERLRDHYEPFGVHAEPLSVDVCLEAADRIEADAKRIADVEAELRKSAMDYLALDASLDRALSRATAAEQERDALKARVEELEKAFQRLRHLTTEAEYVPGDHPIVPVKLANFFYGVRELVRASEGGADPAASPLSEGDGR